MTAAADTKERPFKCAKCKSTFVRRDLLLRHDRTVHAKDGGVPLVSEGRKRAQKNSTQATSSKEAGPSKPSINIDPGTLEQIEASSDVSGSPTPNALSPFLTMEGPVSPVNYRKSPGPSQALTLPKAPQVLQDDEMKKIRERLATEGVDLPNKETFNQYLSTYFTLYHHHMPFLHPCSFRADETEPALLCAVLSIGALYSFHEEQAYLLHNGAKKLVNEFLQNKENFDSRKCPLWTMQSTLLNMIFESWSGGSSGLEWACSIKSLLANMVAGNKYELKLRTEARSDSAPSHAEWVFDESCRRTYYAVYIFFGMLTMTYNHTPAISFNEFDSLELPSSESLWGLEIANEHQWRDSLAASTIVTVRQAYDSLFQGEAIRYSAFATRVMINALSLEVWNLRRSFESLQDVVLEWKIRIALETWESSLDLCEPETIVVPLSTPHKGHPLIFNAMAVYRNTRARLEVDLKNVQEALRYHNAYEVAAAMTASREAVKRSIEMIKVIEQCVECIEIAAMQGINWVAKTSGTNWSIEHPLCGIDLMIILSLWLYRLEHEDDGATDEEVAMYNKVRNLFDEDALETYGPKLCSTVARVWGSMFDNGVVWGISKLMGESFKLHGQALIGHEDEVAPTAEEPLNGIIDPLPMNTSY
ncbi:putative c2h2 finger domain [Phaeomoniella chlamydospora]|uniref:Putative c2h2 finger domain n=1 Tax=Phaeomoniella chlamydospora TaxID=158046 RepID=A0A0G2F153_PHACM|nr:putative c2h2 finger domain [Phaeomoniella chlamydospora]